MGFYKFISYICMTTDIYRKQIIVINVGLVEHARTSSGFQIFCVRRVDLSFSLHTVLLKHD